MSIRLILPAIALLATAATSQQSPVDKARTFTLDGLAPGPAPTADASPTGAAPQPAPTLAVPASPESAAVVSPPTEPMPVIRAVFTLDTPIQDLIANLGAKAVLDKDLPGMSDDENLDKFKTLSLHGLQPQTGGQLTDAMLAKVAADLDVLGGGSNAAMTPAPLLKPGNAKRNGDGTR
ncbi:hypothetical protein [Sphingomonas bacterium]|uniref:hypothetical protein n=1 Tax=Sphingomonas bacterium TaxID=1895847 RepID=UPI00157520C7|nr:hypothetical protein [Sphingomonas bacterium]